MTTLRDLVAEAEAKSAALRARGFVCLSPIEFRSVYLCQHCGSLVLEEAIDVHQASHAAANAGADVLDKRVSRLESDVSVLESKVFDE